MQLTTSCLKNEGLLGNQDIPYTDHISTLHWTSRGNPPPSVHTILSTTYIHIQQYTHVPGSIQFTVQCTYNPSLPVSLPPPSYAFSRSYTRKATQDSSSGSTLLASAQGDAMSAGHT